MVSILVLRKCIVVLQDVIVLILDRLVIASLLTVMIIISLFVVVQEAQVVPTQHDVFLILQVDVVMALFSQHEQMVSQEIQMMKNVTSEQFELPIHVHLNVRFRLPQILEPIRSSELLFLSQDLPISSVRVDL